MTHYKRAVKQTWLEKVIAIHNFHVEQLKKHDNKWRIEDTAEMLGHSSGNVSQSLMLATWLKTHKEQLARFRQISDALEYVREKKKELRLHQIEI